MHWCRPKDSSPSIRSGGGEVLRVAGAEISDHSIHGVCAFIVIVIVIVMVVTCSVV